MNDQPIHEQLSFLILSGLTEEFHYGIPQNIIEMFNQIHSFSLLQSFRSMVTDYVMCLQSLKLIEVLPPETVGGLAPMRRTSLGTNFLKLLNNESQFIPIFIKVNTDGATLDK